MLVQLYTGKTKEIKAYPVTKAAYVIMANGKNIDTEVSNLIEKFSIHIRNHPTSENVHTHDNKAAIDRITDAKIEAWDSKADENHVHTDYVTRETVNELISEIWDEVGGVSRSIDELLTILE